MIMKAAALAALLPLVVSAPALADGASASPMAVKMFSGALDPASEGRRVFLKLNCAGCHGDRAAGGMGPNIQQAEQGNISDAVRDGGDNGMPAFGQYLNSTDLANLGAYLQSIGTAAEPTFQRWWDFQPMQ